MRREPRATRSGVGPSLGPHGAVTSEAPTGRPWQ